MRIISSIQEMQSYSESIRKQKKIVGIVPTMGFLHDGHSSLIRIAKQNADIVVTSIFVNPTQFAPHEDFDKYPRDIERDKNVSSMAGTDVLFIPDVKEIYLENYTTFIEVEKLSSILEGKFRSTHFRGVTTIVAKLFNITNANIAVFGQKDAQQAILIQQMVKDLNFDLRIIVAPIVRESDGLAMSSRNVYLSASEREDSTVLYQSLQIAKTMIENGEHHSSTIISEMIKLIKSKPSTQIDYVSIAKVSSLDEVTNFQKGNCLLISLAVRVGSTRLIDNIILTI